MAIIIKGTSVCPLCGQVIKESDEIVSFPPFISDELDPLFEFSDTGFHSSCFRQHPLSENAESCYREILEQTCYEHRICVVCGRNITDPDDYLTLGCLRSDPEHPLHKYNHIQLHRSCITEWRELTVFYDILNHFWKTGKIRGVALKSLLDEIRTPADRHNSIRRQKRQYFRRTKQTVVGRLSEFS